MCACKARHMPCFPIGVSVWRPVHTQTALHTEGSMEAVVKQKGRTATVKPRSEKCRFHPYQLCAGTPWPGSADTPSFHWERSIIPHRIRERAPERERESARERERERERDRARGEEKLKINQSGQGPSLLYTSVLWLSKVFLLFCNLNKTITSTRGWLRLSPPRSEYACLSCHAASPVRSRARC